VFTGGQFGKVFVKNVKSKQNIELIDQTQAHKRRVIAIFATEEFVFTTGADQKVKQWALEGFILAWSETLDWIPKSLLVSNNTLLLGGPSVATSIKLTVLGGKKETLFHSETIKLNDKNLIQQALTTGGLSETLMAILAAVLCLAFVVAGCICRFKLNKTKDSKHESVTFSLATSEFQTLVTSVLKISFPGYKEVNNSQYRRIKILTRGGGGSVYLGEALSNTCAVFGKDIIVKVMNGMNRSYLLFRRNI
jgi:hypothetical protein